MIEYWVPKRGKKFRDYILDSAQCFNSSSIYIQSDSLAKQFSEFWIVIDHCIDYDDKVEECIKYNEELSVNNTDRSLAPSLFIQLDYKQIDMSNQEEPFHKITKIFE